MSNSVFLKPDENGNWGKVGSDPAGSVSAQLAFQTGATALGNGTPQDVSGYATLAIRLVITGTATVQFEGSIDGLTYSAVAGYTLSMNNVSSASATNDYRANITGLKMFRVRVSAWTSGTVDATGFASSLPFTTPSGTLNTAFGNTDANSVSNLLQGVAAYNLLFDGTNWVRQRMVTNDAGSGNGSVATALIAFNGTTWDRVRVDANKNLKVVSTTQNATATATIATSGTVSDAVTLNGYSLVALSIPTAWDGGNITIQGCDTVGGTYVDVYDSNGNIATVTVGGADRIVGLTGSFMQAVASIPFIKLKAASAVAASRSIVVMAKG